MQSIKNTILKEDLAKIFADFTEKEKLRDSTIFITGCAGFLGYYFLCFFIYYSGKLGIKKIIGVDNFLVGENKWVEDLERKSSGRFVFHHFDVVTNQLKDIPNVKDANYIIHMASVASPVYYRKFPMETLDANIVGLRKLLEFYKHQNIDGLLMFSSSEIYGEPIPEQIPTPEEYRGNVATIGPRACYDEAKRFSETLCYLFSKVYNMSVTLVRPFNNYGPGMNINDGRVPADFARAVVENRDITIYSDGSPTRTFCYISDAIVGYLKTLVYKSFDVFNIGIDRPEISILELARIYKEQGKKIIGYSGKINFSLRRRKKIT